jgi:hypothetical protein
LVYPTKRLLDKLIIPSGSAELVAGCQGRVKKFADKLMRGISK